MLGSLFYLTLFGFENQWGILFMYCKHGVYGIAKQNEVLGQWSLYWFLCLSLLPIMFGQIRMYTHTHEVIVMLVLFMIILFVALGRKTTESSRVGYPCFTE